MTNVVCAATGFLLAVLWFDLMFDVQVRPHVGAELPAEVRSSISSYYARVTTGAAPRSKLVVVAMLAVVVGIIGELINGEPEFWRAFMSLIFSIAAVGLAKWRTVPNAVRIGRNEDDPATQSALIRLVYADHRSSFSFIVTVLALHIVRF